MPLTATLSLPEREKTYSITQPDRLSPDLLSDKLYRIQNFYWIKSKTRGLTKLRLNTVQWEIVRRIIEKYDSGHTRIRHYDLKARQQGISTFWLIWWLDDTIFRHNTTTGLLAHRNDSLQYLMEIVRLAHGRMPEMTRPRLGDDSKLSLSFPDINSKFMGALQIRSTALHNLHVSELCFVEDAELRATLGAVSENTNVTYESTGNGVGNDGYQIYQDCKLGNAEDGMDCAFFPWFVQDEYRVKLNGIPKPRLTPEEIKLKELMRKDWGLKLEDEQVLWRRAKKRALKGMFKQEYPESDEDAFLTSGHQFFHTKKIHSLLVEAKAQYEKGNYIEETDDWIQYEQPIKGDLYVAGGDPADGGNPSVLKIINVTKKREAFLYRARVAVPTFYEMADEWCRKFNNALLGVERNNHGHAVLLGLDKILNYPNLYREEKTRQETVRVGPKIKQQKKELKNGWENNSTTRPIMLNALKAALEGDEDDDVEHFQPLYTIYDQTLLKECLTFEEVKGKFEAIEGETDDDIFASGIATQMFLKELPNAHIEGRRSQFNVIASGQRQAT